MNCFVRGLFHMLEHLTFDIIAETRMLKELSESETAAYVSLPMNALK